jgi:elongation factor Ts
MKSFTTIAILIAATPALLASPSMKVPAYVKATAKELGGDIKVVAFYRYDKGEGIQKREDDFAGEIAKMVGGSN